MALLPFGCTLECSGRGAAEWDQRWFIAVSLDIEMLRGRVCFTVTQQDNGTSRMSSAKVHTHAALGKKLKIIIRIY